VRSFFDSPVDPGDLLVVPPDLRFKVDQDRAQHRHHQQGVHGLRHLGPDLLMIQEPDLRFRERNSAESGESAA